MSKYQPLGEHLSVQSADRRTLTFEQIELLLGLPLPPSAREHRTWWGNERNGSHVQARSWRDAGWLVESVDLVAGWVAFARSAVAPMDEGRSTASAEQ